MNAASMTCHSSSSFADVRPLLSRGSARQRPDWLQLMRVAEQVEHAVARLPRVHRHAVGFELRRCTQLIQVCVMRSARAASGAELEAGLEHLSQLADQLRELLMQAQEVHEFKDSTELSHTVYCARLLQCRSESWLRDGVCAAA